jgi:triphosphoribosyl-dephospho-CoA synthase
MPADDPVRAAFIEACRLDVATRKPGNVSIASAGHGMSAAQFITSAEAAAGALFTRGASVGERILEAVRRTRDAVGCNTNLGIVLLVAPLAAALERLERTERLDLPGGAPDAAGWREATTRVLTRLDLDDARAAYEAIALANPGGLGDAPEQSVHAPPSVDLRAAMSLAAGRDSIARQYANGFLDVFETGLDALRHVPAAPLTPLATLDVFLAFLGGWPDSHIVRKHGLALAQSVTREARGRRDALRRAQARGGLAEEMGTLAAWDIELKRQGVNPGTSADLTVATLFVAAVLQPPVEGHANA